MIKHESLMDDKPCSVRLGPDRTVYLIDNSDATVLTLRYDAVHIEEDIMRVESENAQYTFKLDENHNGWRLYRVENELTRLIEGLFAKSCRLKIADNKMYLTDIDCETHGIIVDIVDVQQYLRDETMVVTNVKSKSIDLILRTYYSLKRARIITEIESVHYKWVNKE